MIEITRVARHMSSDEVKMKMQMTAGFHKMQKWLVIYNALIDPRPVCEIAKHTGLSEFSVHKILSEYNQSGPTSLEPYETVVTQKWNEDQAMHADRF